MADVNAPKSLQDLLAEQLPKDVPFTIYHYSTQPTKSHALFSAPPHARSQTTYCESHLLAASIAAKDGGATGLPEELLIMAIEVLIYTTKTLATIFVSKADSTGCLSELRLPRAQSASPLKVICGTFVSWLARERQREGRKLVVSLFARAQDQYLFPASIDNKNKHVLDDRGLVKWWCKVLDPIVWQYKAEEARKPFVERLTENESANSKGARSEPTAKGYLVIPGYESYDTLRYVPPSPVPSAPRRWAPTHPLLQIAPNPAAPPRCLVPHFPDDPKSRFLDELDEELPDRGTDAMVADGGTPSRSNGMWKSVKTLDQFWEFMAFRQECSSGRIVGFIWVVITPPHLSIPEEDEEPSQQSVAVIESQESVKGSARQKECKQKVKSKTKYGPIPLKVPRILQRTAPQGIKDMPETSQHYLWPTSSRGTICFSPKDYDRAHEIMVHSNFGSRPSTAKATKHWKEEIAMLGFGRTDREWGWTVIGKHVATPSVTTSAVADGTVPLTVMGVRKKRKPESSNGMPSEGVHDLGSGLVRKKPKIEPTPVIEANTDGINTLTAGMVRKKPKVAE